MTEDRDMSSARSFAFGPFTLIPERQLLLRGDAPVRIGGRALDILTVLVEQPGELASKRELMARVWPTTIVDEGSLKVNVASLRRTLGDGGPDDARYIATVIGRGYRFIASVTTNDSLELEISPIAASTRRHNLPTGTTRIVGRADVIENIERDFETSRLVTIAGPGGIGKTTVALAVAERALGSFKDGVWLVDLAPLKNPEAVVNAIAMALGVGVHSESMLAPLCEFLRGREMVLVLDNCEHVLEAAASSASHILAESGGVKILVTSREPLRVVEERVHRLPGLGAPLPCRELSSEEALGYPAIQLFVDRAADRFESFRLSDADAPIVAEICRRLDGLALAIEFAATRVEAFGVSGLMKQIDDSLRHLIGRRAGPERQRTLTATLDWSYSLLSDDEAALLRAVSVFVGTFDIDGASAVSAAAPAATARTLTRLAAKSLLATDADAVPIAYRLLETTRTYCLERLRLEGQGPAVRRRHAEHVCAVLERATGDWAQQPASEWGNTYGRVLDDLRAALAFASLHASEKKLLIRLTVSGILLWNHFSLTHESLAFVTRAVRELEAAGLAGTRSDMTLQLSLAGTTLFARGLMPEALAALQRTLDIATRIGDTEHRLLGLRMVASYELFAGSPDAAIRTLDTFTAVATAADRSALPYAVAHTGLAEMFVGRLLRSQKRLENLFQRDRQDHDERRFARFQYDRKVDIGNILANVQWLTGSPDAAMLTAEAVVERALKTKHQLSLSNGLAVAACPVAFLCGRYEECGRYVAMLEEQITRHGIVVWRPIAMFYRSALAWLAGDVPGGGAEGIGHAIAEFRAIRHWVRMPFYLALLAAALARSGRVVEARETVRCAIDQAHAHNEQWCLPEVLRIQSSILIADGEVREAEALLVESMALARQTGALSWRLRSANDLASLWRHQSRTEDARKMLQPVFDEFTEGFSTRDLVAAADILVSLPSPGDGTAESR